MKKLTFKDYIRQLNEAKGLKFNIGDKAILSKLDYVNSNGIPAVYRKYGAGTTVTVTGRVVLDSGTPVYLVKVKRDPRIYRIYSFQLQHPGTPITSKERLTKKLSGEIKCANCGKMINLDARQHVNHCPNCLHSVHIDKHYGDRKAWCGHVIDDSRPKGDDNWIPSILVPIARKMIKGIPSIVHKCVKCGATRGVKIDANDNREAIEKLPEI